MLSFMTGLLDNLFYLNVGPNVESSICSLAKDAESQVSADTKVTYSNHSCVNFKVFFCNSDYNLNGRGHDDEFAFP